MFAKEARNVRAIIVHNHIAEQMKTVPMIGKDVHRINVMINADYYTAEAVNSGNVGTKNQEENAS